MDVKHLNIMLNPEHDLSKGAFQIAQHVRSNWKWNNVQFRVFTEGITNHLIGVYLKNNPEDMILVRIDGKCSDSFIDRNREREIFKLLHSKGYAPKLYLTFENGMAFEYLTGSIVNVELCKDIRVYPLIARMLAKIHKISYRENDTTIKTPQLWTMMDKFIDLIPEVFSNSENDSRFRQCYPDGKIGLKTELNAMRRAVEPAGDPVVLCHNDLILPNIIYNEKKNSVTFIDYEYAGHNYQAFDIALHFISFADESGFENPQYPSEEYKLEWTYEYLKEYEDNSESVSEDTALQLYTRVNQFTPIANFLYVAWNFMQAELSLVDFDYMKLATNRYEEYRKSLYNLYIQ